MSYDYVTVSFDYMMCIPNSNISSYANHEIREGNCIFAGVIDSQINYPELHGLVNSIIDEIFDELPMEELDDVDKSVSVAIDGKQYVVDNTWEITRNPNKMEDSLKAKSFSYEYLLIAL